MTPGIRQFARSAIVAGLALLLTGCLLSPGKFAASLDLRKSGAFTYRYDGQIHLLALSKLAEMGNASDSFEPDDCYDADFDERECTPAELAEQRAAWDAGAAERKAKKAREAESMRAMLGGIDPSDPKAAHELAAKIRRQKGWSRVDYKGDGLFEVAFRIDSRVDHDFLFPTFEGFPMANVFVALTRRGDGTVRIDAPGFAPANGGMPLQGMMAGMAGAIAAKGDRDGDTPHMPLPEGTFTLVTDGEILANNTEEGPTSAAPGQTLEWLVSARSASAPMALVRID